MQKYAPIKKMSLTAFKRLTGVKKKTYSRERNRLGCMSAINRARAPARARLGSYARCLIKI